MVFLFSVGFGGSFRVDMLERSIFPAAGFGVWRFLCCYYYDSEKVTKIAKKIFTFEKIGVDSEIELVGFLISFFVCWSEK